MVDTTDAPPPAEPPISPVSVRERGYASDASGFWSVMAEEETPDLAWPANIRVYDRMRSQDAQVSSVLRAVTSPIQRTQWYIDGTDVDEEVVEFVAGELGLPIHGRDAGPEARTARLRGRDRFSWNSHLRLALTFLVFGHAYFEQVYRWDEPLQRWRLRKLAFRPARTISKFNVERDGGLRSIEQAANADLIITGPLAVGPTELKINRLVAYVLDREGGNWAGRSLLRPAYKNWLLKDHGLRSWSVGVDRQSSGLPVYEAGADETSLDAGRNIASRARAGDNAGVAIPNGANFTLQGVQGSTIDPAAFVRYQDEQIARAVLAHFLNLGTQTGSWALGSTFADFFTLSLQAVAEEIRDTATAHVIEDLVDHNFGRSVAAPRLVFDEIGSRGGIQDELAAVRKAAGLESDEDLARFVRERVGTTGPAQEAS
ncbi:phage portal protein family protein [Nocardioides sp. CPCC 205120]|uniref:phage portal protein family protein n=1 Tax=Nocardioides sp. CPCC 205120 TaxID=3406462 RepID=UPI003B5028E4